MKIAGPLAAVALAFLAGGCISTDDRLDRPVELLGATSQMDTVGRVIVVQSSNRISREDLGAFAGGNWLGVAPARIVRTTVSNGQFYASFQPLGRLTPIWPAPAYGADYVIRFEATETAFLVRQSAAGADPKVYWLKPSGALAACRGAESTSAHGRTKSANYAEVQVIRLLLP